MLNTSANLRLVRASQQRHGAPKPRIVNPMELRITHLAQHPQKLLAPLSQLKQLHKKAALPVESLEISRPQLGSAIIHVHCPHCGECLALQVNSQSALLAFYLGNFSFAVINAFVCYLLFGLDISSGAFLVTLCTVALLETFSAVNHHSVVSFLQPEDRAHHTLWHSGKI